MSADNWAPCPKAEGNPAHANDTVSNPMREDWEIGLLDGEFYVYYTARCRSCGYEFKFKHEEMVK